jgi:hypothetical protein
VAYLGTEHLLLEMVRVEPLVWDSTASEVFADATRFCRKPRAHESQGCGCALQQERASSHEAFEDGVTKRGLCGKKMLQPLPRHDHDLTGLDHPRRDEEAKASQQIELADKSSRAVPGITRSVAFARMTISTAPDNTT